MEQCWLDDLLMAWYKGSYVAAVSPEEDDLLQDVVALHIRRCASCADLKRASTAVQVVTAADSD